MSLLIALALGAANPVPPPLIQQIQGPAESAQSAESAAIDQAYRAIGAKDPAKALALAEQVIASEEAAHRGDQRRFYSAGSPMETVAYGGLGAKEGRDTVVLGPEWGQALFLKGYALIDLGRPDE